MTGDRVIRWTAASAVLTVATIAATVSYLHIEHLALTNGQSALSARLLPVSVDGAVLAASMVMLDAARRGVPAPALARVMLTLGVAATLGANAAIGAAHGVVGVLVSAWPAVAFLGSAEVALGMARVRSQAVPDHAPESVPATAPAGAPEPALVTAVGTAPVGVPGGVPETVPETVSKGRTRPSGALSLGASRARTPKRAPEVVFEDELLAGVTPSLRAIKSRCHVGQVRAREIRNHLAALAEIRSQAPVPEVA